MTTKHALPETKQTPAQRPKWMIRAIVLSATAIALVLVCMNYRYIYDHYLIFCY